MSIEVKDLSYTYMPGTPFEHTALRHMDFTIDDGEFVGIVGRTGSGKSTLLQLISQLIKVTEGQIRINGIDYSDKKADRKALRREVGVVFQYPEYQLFEETIEEDIAFGPGKLGIPQEEIEGCVRQAMMLVGLDYEKYRKKSPFECSGGQKRRVAIAGVLAMNPKILILDEPTSGLDPQGREELMEMVEGLNQKGMTILMVSHNMDNIAEYANRVLVLNDGELLANSAPEDVFSNEELLKKANLDMPSAARFAKIARGKGIPVPENTIRYEDLYRFLTEYYKGEME